MTDEQSCNVDKYYVKTIRTFVSDEIQRLNMEQLDSCQIEEVKKLSAQLEVYQKILGYIYGLLDA